MAVIIDGSNTPTAGGVGYGDGSELAFTNAGTSGQVLTSAGSSAPTWTAPSSGTLVYLSTLTASTSATLTYSGFTSTYPTYMIVLRGLTASATGGRLKMELQMSNATFIFATTAALGNNSSSTGSTQYYANEASTISPPTISVSDDPAGSGICGQCYFFSPATSGKVPTGTFLTASTNNGGIGQSAFATGGFQVISSLACTGFRLSYNSGNIVAGTVDIYGIKNS